MSFQSIAIIGFGEVGQTLAADLLASGKSVHAFDILFIDKNSKPYKAAQNLKINIYDTSQAAVLNCDLIISCVTAAQTLAAASSVALTKLTGKYYLDVNSSSPSTKSNSAEAINEAGGKYIEASIMSPIAPKNISSPIILGGPFAQEFTDKLMATGFSGAKFYSEQYGKAAATKLCRSVIIKGLEALVSESMLSAVYYGVEQEVLASLNNLFPNEDWEKQAHYLISRTLQHGQRRSEEMLEAAKTVQEANIEPIMSLATAQRQAWASQYKKALSAQSLEYLVREIREILEKEKIQ